MEVRPAEAIALPVSRPAVLAQDLVWPLLVALATAAAIVPFWASELLPYQDAPQHIAAVRVLADYHSPGFAFDRWFELDLAAGCNTSASTCPRRRSRRSPDRMQPSGSCSR
jgi:hypothetical protein